MSESGSRLCQEPTRARILPWNDRLSIIVRHSFHIRERIKLPVFILYNESGQIMSDIEKFERENEMNGYRNCRLNLVGDANTFPLPVVPIRQCTLDHKMGNISPIHRPPTEITLLYPISYPLTLSVIRFSIAIE